jgi:hypothetical protein
MKKKDDLNIQDVQFLLLRLIFWAFVVLGMYYIHVDAKKQKENKLKTYKDKCLITPSN